MAGTSSPGPSTGPTQFTFPGRTELKYPKVGSALDDLIARVQSGEISAEEAAKEAPIHRGDSVGVAIHLSGNVDGVVRFLEANGASNISARDDYIEAYVPILLLAETSDQPGVVRVRPIQPPEEPQSGSGIAGNGPGVHGSAAWNQAGFTGEGIKVGVIDGGFGGFAALMGTEVPADVHARCYRWLGEHSQDLEHCGDSTHGTAVAESVLDIAPDVSLYIADPQSPGDLRDTVDWMISQGVSVINHSRTWLFDGPGDGTSPSSISPLNTVDRAVAAGIVWVNAAGNSGRRAWFKRGPFSYSTISVDGEDVRVINFEASNFKNRFHLWGSLQLRWDDTWGGATRDLDLLLVRPDEEEIDLFSIDPQSGEEGHDPYERVSAFVRYDVMIANRGSGEPSWIQLLAWRGGGVLTFKTPEAGSITNPAESANPGMMTVGAAHWQNVSSIESYSSRGPTPDGRVKPDVVGADCGQTAAGSRPFCGTSQAAPHVAGLAALVRQKFPSYSPVQVVSYLKENAEQRIDDPDPNNTWGHGFIVLPPISTGVASISDLVVETPTVSESAPAAGASFTLSATVRNQDNGASVSTTLRYYQSSDSTITTSDTEIGTDSVSRLNASESGDESISLDAPSTPGAYHYGACVDAVSDESDTTNNCSHAVTVTVGAAPAPDLVVDTPTVDTSAPVAGARFTLSATVRNQDNGSSAFTTLRYYQSTDSTITTGDTLLGTDPVSRLDASGSGGESISLTAPSTPGTYHYGACVDAVSEESDTTNNCSTAVTVTVGVAPAPDLEVDTPTVDTSAPAAGTTFALSATVRNQGNGSSDSATLRYYRSTDSTITTGDTAVGTDSVSSLDAAESGGESISLTAPSTPGTYHYGACVDAVSDESDTTNNCSTAVTVTVGAAPAPDLVVDAPTVDTSAPAAGTTFALSATVRNQGNGSSDSATLRYYRSNDSTITADDTAVGTDSVGGLSAAGSSAESISLTAPSTPGTYYYGACVDAVSDESDTTNNCSVAVNVAVGAAPAADLVVDAPTVDTSAPTAGARFTLNATVRNQGSGRSDSTTLRYYQSTDSTITTGDTAVGTDSVFGLGASASGAEWVNLTAPSEPGTYYYGACVDAVSDESDTTNNCSVAVTVTVGAAPAPDLVVDTPTVDTSAPTAGARFTLNATVRNQGNGSSAFTTLRYYQSTDQRISTADTAVGTDSVFRLNASASGDESISLTAPSEPGTYYYGACVDAVSDESDTTNNCSVAVTVTVGAAPAPDLVVDTPTVSESAPTAGARFTLNATVRNQGNGSSAFTTLRYYQSTDQTISTADTAVGTDSVFRLNASASGDESISLTAPSEPGTYYYGACVDAVSDESDTTNNCSVAVTVTVGAAPAPDLVVDTPTVSESAPTAGARFTLNATVRNQGNGSSDSATLRYYRSTDSTITTDDTLLGMDSVGSLSAAGSSPASIPLTAPSTPGTYHYGACVTAVSDESDTTNNCSTAVTVTVGAAPAPDLVVGTPTVSESSPNTGASFTLSATVRNQGNGSSAFTTLRYYRSTDSTITTGDTAVGTDSVSSLDAAESGDESISLTAPSTTGTYYYGACVDAVSDETDTTNNCSVAVTVTVGAAPAPDLVVDTPTVSESAPTAGARFTLNAMVRNQGNGSSDSATLRYYRSTDSTITTGDTAVGTDSVSSLDAAESGDESISLTAPSTSGTYYYGACVESVSGESDTTNNCSTGVTVTVGTTPVNPPNQRYTWQGSTTVVSWDSVPDADYYNIYYDDFFDSNCRLSFGNPFLCEELASNITSASYTHMSPDETTNYYWITACNDAGCSAIDSANPARREGPAPAPDLVVDTPTVSESAPTAGARFTLNATVRNQGNGSSAFTTLRYYRSTDSTITTGDTAVGTDSVSSLDAAESGDESISLTAPSTPGTYYYGACVDAVSDESDTTNNCSVAVTVTVGAAPAADLVVDTPTVSESAPTAGASFTLNATVRNQGSGSSAFTTLRYYQSTDSTITADDTAVGTDSVGGLSAAGSSAESFSLTAPSTAGTYYYGACVDPVDGESDTTNNCSSAESVTVVSASGSDLVIESFTPQNSNLDAGAFLPLYARVRNQGTGLAATTPVSFYLSTDATISTSDTRIDGQYVRRLAPSESGTAQVSTFAPSTPGTYYYGACVQAVSGETNTTNNCSAAGTVTVGDAPANVPGVPAGLTAAPNGQTQIDLSWTAPSSDGGSEITGYRIEVSTNGSDWSDLVADTDTTATNYSHTGLTAGSTRHYRVSAINSSGTGSASNVADATTDTQAGATTCSTGGAVTNAAANPGLAADCETLLAARDTLKGSGTLNWSADTPIANWDGITVSGTPQRVTRLELRVRGVTRVTGTIPSDLGNLAGLEVLSIYGASTSDDQPIGLTGRIPAELGQLTNLRELTLHQHRLSGTIPVEIGDLTNLETLNLNFTQLSGAIPAELGGLTNLKTLNLYDNGLTGAIPGLGNLAELESLNLSLNRLSGTIPTQVADLTKLKVLSLGFNQLSGTIPTQLGSLFNLETLAMGFNRLSGAIPTSLGNLTKLKSLSLGGNQLTGTIPSELGDLTDLMALLLHRNRLTGSVPTELSGLTMLRQLQLSNNQLTGCIPAALREVDSNDLARLSLPNCGSVGAPGAPTGLTATADGQTEVDLSWSAPSDDGGAAITGYRIEVSTNGSSWSDLVANTGSITTSYSHTGLTAGSTRYYRVSAINSAGTGSASNTDSATTEAAPPTKPGAPTGLSATADGQTEIDLSWTAPSSDGGAVITGYKIEVSTNGSSWSDLVANTGSITTSYSHTGLTAGSTRYYRVSAINSAGTGSASNTDSATTTEASVSDGTCTVDLIVELGESCTYPGTSTEFSVDADGTGRFLFTSSGSSINLRNTTINGVTYTFVASKQSDGSWRVEEVG